MRREAGGFTLVELMVVVAIIAVLISVLLPSMGACREAARSAMCGSNLHQLLTGWEMYANENNGLAMPARDYRDTQYYKFWTGAQDKSYAADDLTGFDATKGFIWPYLRSQELNACPSWKGKSNNGQLGYGYNWMYLSYYDGNPDGSGNRTFKWTSVADIRMPARVVVFADCARPVKGTDGSQLETTPFLGPPSQQYPSFHARHNGHGNVGWADGHVSSEAARWLHDPVYSYMTSTFTTAVLKTAGIGDLDSDDDPTTDELFVPK
ncbi:MAG: hypothetical protein BIFFINMI_01687 [Phycisphaerae bacterium]|nr:hypothetical protein [Phycisphaerae bacterium]